jgi:NAD-dependent dihydropyrimidine dehydrogenase PreA subunit
MQPRVDIKKCTGCGTCASVCPVDVFELKNEKFVVVKPSECTGCNACIENCPAGAIRMV